MSGSERKLILPTITAAILVLAGLTGCHNSSSGDSTPPINIAFVGNVTIAPAPNPWVPQVAVISVETSTPTRIELRITGPEGTREVVAAPFYSTFHPRIPLAGMKPDTEYSVEVIARNSDGQSVAAPNTLQWRTDPLPAAFPPIEVQTSMPRYMEDGHMLLSILGDVPGSIPTIIDADGDVVWFVNSAFTLPGEQVMAFPMKNGNLMLLAAQQLLIEMNLLGDIIQVFHASGLGNTVPGSFAVATESFHHEFVELPEGSDADYAVLGTELRTLPNYPMDEVDPTQTVPSADVIADEIIEFKKDGTVVRRISLFDVLDPYRIVYDSLNDFWDDHYGRPTYDWSHANALVLDERTNSWVLSLRHQDCVIQVQRNSGVLEWILGNPERWNPPWSNALLTGTGANFDWPYHQHAPQLLPDGTMMLFDNGNNRAIPPAPKMPPPQSYSRAVQYRIDATNRTAEQLWAYGGPPGGSEPSFYSFFVSSAFRQPVTGNVVICDGGKGGPGIPLWCQLFEVTTEPTPQVVFQLKIQSSTSNYFMYRAYKLSGVYR
ncbi:MAG: aryl-sulfate sulfotransferase [bacterium]|nr:aryl-sulfate sulfotransferase [bacterium]